jgi:phage-related minor tail protein
MGSSLDRFVETGKLSFGDFATSVIMDMLKIELKAAAMKMFQAAGGLSGIAGLFGFAEGGMIPTEGPVLVGEEGPELIRGAAGRQVIPNNQLGTGSAGGSVTNNYYSISAIDAKSVAQLFAENRMTLLGNVRQAEKELPIRGR